MMSMLKFALQSYKSLSGTKNNLRHLPSFNRFISKPFHLGVIRCNPGEYEFEDPKSPEDIVNVIFLDKRGKEHKIKGKVGDNILYLAHRHNIELEGACEASLACSTCHVYVDDQYGNKIPEATDEEEDLLDMAPGLKDNSRLGCQIVLCKQLEGLRLTLPPITRNFYVDGHVPQPH